MSAKKRAAAPKRKAKGAKRTTTTTTAQDPLHRIEDLARVLLDYRKAAKDLQRERSNHGALWRGEAALSEADRQAALSHGRQAIASLDTVCNEYAAMRDELWRLVARYLPDHDWRWLPSSPHWHVADNVGWDAIDTELRQAERVAVRAAAAGAECEKRDCEPTHSLDFTSVDWFGTRYTFAKGNQAEAVRVLWQAWKSGQHSLSQETIGKAVAPSADRFEMSKTFRHRKDTGRGYDPHPAWGTMIRTAEKGCYRLAEPDPE